MLNNLWPFLQTHSPLFYLTQPIWRDEAFSALLALNPPLKIIQLTTNDFNPPLYFLLLHFWIQLVGYSEIALRLLSFSFYIATLYVGYLFAGEIARKSDIAKGKLAIITTVLLAANPMLVYYAFEARAYSFLAFLSTVSMYAFYRKQQKLNILANGLGLYTHYYFIPIIIVQLLCVLLHSGKITRRFVYLFVPFIFFLPWMPFLFKQTVILSAGSWHPPVDRQLWLASFGTIFTGFTGNPPVLWRYHQILTLILLSIAFSSLFKQRNKIFLLVLWLLFPPLMILTISLFKPIWHIRYLIHTAVAEVMLVAIFIFQLTGYKRRAIFALLFTLSLFWNVWFPPYVAKTDYRTPIDKLKQALRPSDLVVATDPIHFFETRYYLLHTDNQVKLYSPQPEKIPTYLGTAILSKDDLLRELPHNRRVYLVNKDTSIDKMFNF